MGWAAKSLEGFQVFVRPVVDPFEHIVGALEASFYRGFRRPVSDGRLAGDGWSASGCGSESFHGLFIVIVVIDSVVLFWFRPLLSLSTKEVRLYM